MKQAILIMAHKDTEQIKKLVMYFEGKCDIIIHIDKKSKITQNDESELAQLPGVLLVCRKIEVHWGSSKLLKCQLLLMKLAIHLSDCKYIHLISGQDYPIKPLNMFLDFFSNTNKEYIGGVHLPNPRWDGNTYKRIQYFYFTEWVNPRNEMDINRIWNFADIQERLGIRRNIPNQVKHLYGGSAWFSLTRECCESVLKYTKEKPALLKRFRFTFVPDEMYIQTVVRNINKPQEDFANTIMRYIYWEKSGDYHPASLDESHFCKLSSSDAFFARKLDHPRCVKLQKLIDKYLLSKSDLTIGKTGIWNTRNLSKYTFDEGLCHGIYHFCKVANLKDIVDLGCGPGWYVSVLRKNKIITVGYDGNPYTPELSSTIMQTQFPCECVELTEQIVFEEVFDVTLFISVGVYIPKEYEHVVWNNLINSFNKYLIINWGNEFLPDNGMINPHTVEDIMNIATSLGLVVDFIATDTLRRFCHSVSNKENIVVLRKKQ